jgi:hypothetical protein
MGRGDDLAEFFARDGAAYRDMDVRRQPPLRLDRGEVLNVVADVPAQVLDEPVEQRGEVERVPRGGGAPRRRARTRTRRACGLGGRSRRNAPGS